MVYRVGQLVSHGGFSYSLAEVEAAAEVAGVILVVVAEALAEGAASVVLVAVALAAVAQVVAGKTICKSALCMSFAVSIYFPYLYSVN